MNFYCILIGHKWSKWIYVKQKGRYDEMLKKTCSRCNKLEYYTGMTEIDRDGKKVPHGNI